MTENAPRSADSAAARTALVKAESALGRFIVWSEGSPGMWLWARCQWTLMDLTAAGDAMEAVRAALAHFDGSRATDQACPDCGHHLSLHNADGCGISTCDCRNTPPKDADGT